MSLRNRSNFKQTLSTLQRLQQEARKEPHVLCFYTNKQWEARSSASTWWNSQSSWWTPYHSESQEGDEPSIEWTGRPVACSIWQASSQKTLMNSIYFVADWSFTADGGLLYPTGGVKTTHQMTCFPDASVCNNLATDEMAIAEYSLTTNTKANYKIHKARNLYLVLRLRGETEHDTNDNVTTKTQNTFNTHEHWHVSAQFSCLLVRFLSSWLSQCIVWLKGVVYVISSTHEVCASPSTLSPPFPFTVSRSHSSLTSCTSSCTFSSTLETVAILCTPLQSLWTLLTTLTSSQRKCAVCFVTSMEKAPTQHVYVWEEEWAVFIEMSLVEQTLAARLRLGRRVDGCFTRWRRWWFSDFMS